MTKAKGKTKSKQPQAVDVTQPTPATDARITIVQTPLDDLSPYERNARTHSAEQVAAIARSIKTFGFNNPILVDSTRGIIAGHGRLLAARELGLTTVPVLELSHLSDAEKRAYIIADNQLALQAGWDVELLLSELELLKGDGFDISAIGFSETELEVLAKGWQQDWEKYNAMAETDTARSAIKVTCDPRDRSDVIEVIKTALEATAIEHVTVE